MTNAFSHFAATKWVAFLAIFLTCCIGCVRDNLATMGRENLVAIGKAKGRSQTEIFEVRIGSLEKPFDRQFVFYIRLNSGQTIRSDSFSLDSIKRIATRTNNISSGDWKGCISYMVDAFGFIYRGDQLVQFSAAEYKLPGGERLSATMGDAKGNNFYSFPLTKEQFQALFGEPEFESRQTVL